MKTNLSAFGVIPKKKRTIGGFKGVSNRYCLTGSSEEPSYSKESSNRLSEEALKDLSRYQKDVKNSQNFYVGSYPNIDLRARRALHSVPLVTKVYDSSSHTDANLYDDWLLCFAKLAICFYNIREDTCFHNVKLIMATKSGVKNQFRHITFEATMEPGVAVTFQTELFVSHPNPFPRIEIIFVRIKPENSQQVQTSEFDSKAQIYQHRLSQVIQTYTLDSQLDSQYSLALYLAQYALVSHDLHRLLRQDVAKYDFESLKVVELTKPVADYPTYHITFKAPCVKSRKNKFYTFKAEIRMPRLFPTTLVYLSSGDKLIRVSGTQCKSKEEEMIMRRD